MEPCLQLENLSPAAFNLAAFYYSTAKPEDLMEVYALADNSTPEKRCLSGPSC